MMNGNGEKAVRRKDAVKRGETLLLQNGFLEEI